MTIDILTYELKYKNDRAVLDLINDWHSLKEIESAGQESYSADQDKINDLEGTADDLKSQIDDYSDEISDLAVKIMECHDEKDMTGISIAVDKLNDLVKRMQF